MRVQIICKASIKDGLGHLFRTNTFASVAVKEHEVEVISIVDNELESIFSSVPYKVIFVRSDNEVVSHVQSFIPDVLVFDLLELNSEVFRKVKHIPRLKVSISPIFNQIEQMDVLFTRAIDKTEIKNVTVRNGLQYAIFSQHCQQISDETFFNNLNLPQLSISICMGGTDASNKTLRILKELSQLEIKLTLWVMLGEGYSHSYTDLAEVSRGKYQHEVILAKTNRSMWNVMSNSVFGIFAGGLTTMEALYNGLPCINLVERNIQNDIIEGFVSKGYCFNGGYFSENGLEQLVDTIYDINKNRNKLVDTRYRIKNIIDNFGSKRILDEIKDMI